MNHRMPLVLGPLLALLVLAMPATGSERLDGRLVWQPAAVAPGETAMLGLRLEIQDRWHIQAGVGSGDEFPEFVATTIAVELPPGFEAGEPVWPPAHDFSLGGIPAAGYEGTVLIAVPVTVPADADAGAAPVSVTLGYQACDDRMCEMPTRVTLEGGLTVLAAGGVASPLAPDDAALFAETLGEPVPDDIAFADGQRVRVTLAMADGGAVIGASTTLAVALDIAPDWHIQAGAGSGDEGEDFLATTIDLTLPAGWSHGAPRWPDAHDFSSAGIVARGYEGRAVVLVPIEVPADAPAGTSTIEVLVGHQACDANLCDFPVDVPRTIEFPVVTAADADTRPGLDAASAALFGATTREPSGSSPAPAAGGPGFSGTLVGLLLLAVVGGFLLNLTPCVLPIIPLKIMGLAESAGRRGRTFALGAAMAAGIIAFFIGLGLVIAGVNEVTSANQLFNYPVFPITIGIVIAALAIGMCGLFSIRLPNAAYRFTPRHDTYVGSFLFGIMAAILSTPCTAPFMGSAMAASVGQSAGVVLAVFGAVGIGMALPYLVLAANPRWIDRMPRTGPASELLKQVLGLLMLAAAAYFIGVGVSGLLVTPPEPPSRAYFWPVFLLVAAAGGWTAYRTLILVKTRTPRFIFSGVGLALVAIAVVIAPRLAAPDRDGPIAWVYFTPERFEDALADGKVVALEFTAEWCLNCKLLEKQVLNTDMVAERLAESDVVPMKVDLTGNYVAGRMKLEETGSLTIPWLVIFAPNGDAVFAQNFYTPENVVDAVDEASGRNAVARRE